MRADGHEQLRVLGPPGIVQLLRSYEHLFKWRHPQLLLDPWAGPTSHNGSSCHASIIYEVPPLCLCGARASSVGGIGIRLALSLFIVHNNDIGSATTSWRYGSAPDYSPEGCVFNSCRGHF